MDSDQLKREISGLNILITQQIRTLEAIPGSAPQLYIDLLKDNIKKLYQYVHEIEKGEEQRLQNLITATPLREATPPASASDQVPAPAPVEGSPVPEPLSEPDQVSPVFREKPPKEKPPVVKGETFADHSGTLAEKMMQTEDNSLGARLRNAGFTDLKTAIGINEKFLFINELFKGDLSAYNEVIGEINGSATHSEAMVTFNTKRIKYNWDIHSESYKRLKDIVERKFR